MRLLWYDNVLSRSLRNSSNRRAQHTTLINCHLEDKSVDEAIAKQWTHNSDVNNFAVKTIVKIEIAERLNEEHTHELCAHHAYK